MGQTSPEDARWGRQDKWRRIAVPRDFRFGVQIGRLPEDGWREKVKKYESLGFSSILFPDHFGNQLEPLAAISAIAGATETINVGALVFDVDYRHPVVLAKAAATLDCLSGGRLEFGFGAGWMETDYIEAGIPYDPPAVRVSRMEEALDVMKAMWTENPASYKGEFYEITGIAGAHESATKPHPKVLIGGGGKRVLSIAGRHADIVGINPNMAEGKVTGQSAADLSPTKTREKIGWVRAAAEAAGRDPDEIEYNTLVFVMAILDDPSPVRATMAATTGMSEDEVADCPLFLTGPPSEIQDRLIARREETGISYIVVQDMGTTPPGMFERFAEEVVAPLTS